MNNENDKLLSLLRDRIASVQSSISVERCRLNELINKPIGEIKSMNPEDQMVYDRLRGESIARISELESLSKSPFFVRCDINILSNDKMMELYFSKYHFSERNIYSWVSPIARIRFESPGSVQYKLPNGEVQKGDLIKKEQYLITEGRVVFYATEDKNNPRKLVYQDHFSNKKDGFVLPEIVSIMEKAQDTVIRAHHIGPFLISGPAGSGKTTLALHRVAFLVQSPDTSHLYSPDSIIVFVQDNGTKDYFTHLLPELGINNVTITTFNEWASMILGISDAVFIDRRGDTNAEKDKLEFDRLIQISENNISDYSKIKKELIKNSKRGIDRLDLSIALKSYLNKFGKFEIKTKHNVVVKGEIKKKTRTNVPKYSLMIFDEFQNYMPMQLNLLNTTLDSNTNSSIYVGDMAQQVRAGTIKSFDSFGLTVNEERVVKLHKVYRNTKQILNYINKLGYNIEIPMGIKDGPEVVEMTISDTAEYISYIKNLSINDSGIIGVISHDEDLLNKLSENFKDNNKIICKTITQSQGVEFDIVCIIGINNKFFDISHLSKYPESYVNEKRIINKDLMYVALTRAIRELHILGESNLRDLLK